MQNQLTEKELKRILKRVVWDYDISEDDLLEIFNGRKSGVSLNELQLKAKLLNTYRWHQLVQWFGIDNTKGFLKDEIIGMIFPVSYRQKLFHAKRILRA